MSEVIVGISALDCESAVTILQDGRIVWSASEERFTRKKQQAGFPHESLLAGLRYASLTTADVTGVAYSFLSSGGEAREKLRNLGQSIAGELTASTPLGQRAYHLYRFGRSTANGVLRLHPRYNRQLLEGLRRHGLDAKLRYFPHHLTHAESCYRTSGWDRSLVVVMDGYGTGECTTIWLGENRTLRKVASIRSPHSLGNFYQSATVALGFIPNRHEGKVLGLAAHGNPEPIRSELLKRFRQTPGAYAIESMIYGDRQARRFARERSREDVAAGFQSVLEEVGTALVRHFVDRFQTPRVVMAGGVMANVKLNQRIAEIPGVEDVWVFPAMADAGTAFGAALCSTQMFQDGERLRDVYFGPGYTDAEMADALRRAGLTPLPLADADAAIAVLLTTGACVARFAGRMEFGPRALGNRSILVRATDPGTNDSLNKRLRRTEFMPFAPATLDEYAEQCYRRIDRGRGSAEFMTMTFDCTERMRAESPAAVHVDNTARPQLVRKDIQPSYYRIIEEYRRLTGIPTVINTSFNMHEEPIVCSPDDAVRAFLDGDLEFLALGPHVVANPRAPFTKTALDRLATRPTPAGGTV